MLRLLFPFVRTYRRLDLKSRWWHRLALVALLGAMVVSIGYQWSGAMESDSTYRRLCADEATRPFNPNTYQAAWDRCDKEHFHPWENLGIAVANSVWLWYVLQLGYRVVIYIAFGSSRKVAAA